jgi:hypothetical protein
MDFNAQLTLRDRGTMAARAAYLITIFLPFLLLAPLLFLLANLLLRWDQRQKSRRCPHSLPSCALILLFHTCAP